MLLFQLQISLLVIRLLLKNESSHTDSTLSTGSGMSQSVSSQVSESRFTATQDMSDYLTINQSNTNDLLDLGLKYKGFRWVTLIYKE